MLGYPHGPVPPPRRFYLDELPPPELTPLLERILGFPTCPTSNIKRNLGEWSKLPYQSCTKCKVSGRMHECWFCGETEDVVAVYRSW